MAPIKILAFEDEFLHAEQLKNAVEELGYHLVDVFGDTTNIEEKIVSLKPDIILMDIDLGAEETGIDAAQRIRKKFTLPIIYTTSFQDSEVFDKAKKTMPKAYLTKPLDTFALGRSIELALLQQDNQNGSLPKTGSTANYEHFFIKEDRLLKRLKIKDIIQLRADDKYCFIYSRNAKRLMVRERLKNIFSKLPDTQFIQINRSSVVNIEAIEAVNVNVKWILVDGEHISVGDAYRTVVESIVYRIG